MAYVVDDVSPVWDSVQRIMRVLGEAGIEQAFVKPLATNQDNEKNQIYLSTEDSLMTVLPGVHGFLSQSTSTKKRRSAPGRGKQMLSMKFSWIAPSGRESRVQGAKLIYYLQYPELRFSGFLAGAESAPDPLRRDSQDGYGRRVLILGVRNDEVLGAVVTDLDSPSVVDWLISCDPLPGHSLLLSLPLPSEDVMLNRSRLIDEITEISGMWQPAQVLRPGDVAPVFRRAQQGAGWTLEALLGIEMNGSSSPDKYGYEIKAIGGSGKVSLITTEPDFGCRHDEGFRVYMDRFGWDSQRSRGKRVFNGEHFAWLPRPSSGAELVIENWDHESNGPSGAGEPNVLLRHSASSEVIAGWTYSRLASKWSAKHTGCVYVTYTPRNDDGPLPTHYSYGPVAYVGSQTSPLKMLRALADHTMYLDPGDSLSATGAAKKRMQWRTRAGRGKSLADRLTVLYEDFDVVDLSI